jgi:hypothetical protein
MQIARRTYPVTVYTQARQIEGVYQAIGQFMTAINDPDSTCLVMDDATLTMLSPRVALRPVSVPQLVVNKDDVQFISFADQTVQNEAVMLKRVARVVAYTSAFVLRGNAHIGAEDSVRDLLDTLKGTFQPLTEAMVYPLIETRVSVPREHDLIVVNARAIQLYHPDPTT